MAELTLVDPAWEMIDPNPNIWSLFSEFDNRFFNGKLTSSFVELTWSSGRMTSTAGLCAWNPRTNFATIKLSQPLLQLRSRADLVETLLHEMIHAFLFVTRQDDNHESHGPKFHMHMFRINKEAGTNITVYHTFHDEVKHYQQHIWRCDGPCAAKPPYFGYVRRASNRKPGSYDYWWATHQANCGGTFNKISEPKKIVIPKSKSGSKTKITLADLQNNKRISDFFKISAPSTSGTSLKPTSSILTEKSNKLSPIKTSPARNGDIRKYISPVKYEPTFPGEGQRLGSSLESNPVKKLKLEDFNSGVVSSSHNLPDKPYTSLPQAINDQSDEEDSFTYELPDLDESIIIDSIKTGQTNSSSDQKSIAANLVSQPKISQVKPQTPETDDEDVFTYELPNFTPFLGTGYKLGSVNNKTPNVKQFSTKILSQKPQVINLE